MKNYVVVLLEGVYVWVYDFQATSRRQGWWYYIWWGRGGGEGLGQFLGSHTYIPSRAESTKPPPRTIGCFYFFDRKIAKITLLKKFLPKYGIILRGIMKMKWFFKMFCFRPFWVVALQSCRCKIRPPPSGLGLTAYSFCVLVNTVCMFMAW